MNGAQIKEGFAVKPETR